MDFSANGGGGTVGAGYRLVVIAASNALDWKRNDCTGFLIQRPDVFQPQYVVWRLQK